MHIAAFEHKTWTMLEFNVCILIYAMPLQDQKVKTKQSTKRTPISIRMGRQAGKNATETHAHTDTPNEQQKKKNNTNNNKNKITHIEMNKPNSLQNIIMGIYLTYYL